MRLRLPLGRTLFFLCAFLFSIVATLPLRIAADWLRLGDRGLAAREALGSVWTGRLNEGQLGPVPLGDLEARLRSLPLIIGRATVGLYREGNTPFTGGISVARHGFGLEDTTGRLDVASLFAPLPIGSLDLNDLTVRFANGQCAHAEGKVSGKLIGNVGGLSLPNGVSGNARCDGGALLLPLASLPGTETLNIRLFQDGRYQTEFMVRANDPAMVQRLSLAGFRAKEGNLYISQAAGTF